MIKKYKLLPDTEKEYFGTKIFRIKALMSFSDVNIGDIGGYIEKEENLDHYGNAWISGDAQVFENARVARDAQVFGNARVAGDAQVFGNAQVFGDAQVYENARVARDAQVFENARVAGDAQVFENARVASDNDICWFSKFGSSNRTTTAYKNKDGEITVKCGCFIGSLKDFILKVNETHEENKKYLREYIAIIETIKAKFDIE